MKKILLTTILYTAYSLSTAYAVIIYVDSPSGVTENHESVISVRLNTEGKTINSIEGMLVVNGIEKEIYTIHTGGSAFALWPNKPSISGETIAFIGGSPEGLIGNDLLLFTIAVRPSSPSTSFINIRGVTAYLADGQATPLSITPAVYALSEIPTSEVNETVGFSTTLPDTTSPVPFKIELGRDDSVFSGKYFISFETTDTQSGISKYEVKEGDRPFIRTGTPYVLQDQTAKSKITVRATDAVGNVRTATLNDTSHLWFALITSVFAIIGVILIRIRKH